jgi:hypothetical protein
MRVFSDLKKGTKTFDTKLIRHYLELFLGGRSDGNPEENQVTGTSIFRNQAKPNFRSS